MFLPAPHLHNYANKSEGGEPAKYSVIKFGFLNPKKRPKEKSVNPQMQRFLMAVNAPYPKRFGEYWPHIYYLSMLYTVWSWSWSWTWSQS